MRSIINRIIIILIALFGFTIVQANTAGEIIAKHIEAHGGAKKWEAVKAIAIHATFTAFSEENEFYALKTGNGEYYSDLYLGKHKVKEAFDGTKGWTIDPWHQILHPRELNKAEVNVFYQKADLFTPFYRYKEKGYTVEYLGEKNIEGVDTYALKLTRINGREETWYLDKNTYLEYKCESVWVDFASPVNGETYFDDFREVEGLILPFYVERMFRQRNRMLVVNKYDINPEYDQEILIMPRSEEMKELAFMEGEWKVSVDAWGRNQQWRTVDQQTSVIAFEATNSLKQDLRFEYYYVQSLFMNYSYYPSNKKYRLRIFNTFYNTMEFFEGSFEEGVLRFDNLKYKGQDQDPVQLTIYDIKKHSYVMEIKTSRDKGENWLPNLRFSFSRE